MFVLFSFIKSLLKVLNLLNYSIKKAYFKLICLIYFNLIECIFTNDSFILIFLLSKSTVASAPYGIIHLGTECPKFKLNNTGVSKSLNTSFITTLYSS